MKLCCGEGLIAGRPITPISKPSFVTDVPFRFWRDEGICRRLLLCLQVTQGGLSDRKCHVGHVGRPLAHAQRNPARGQLEALMLMKEDGRPDWAGLVKYYRRFVALGFHAAGTKLAARRGLIEGWVRRRIWVALHQKRSHFELWPTICKACRPQASRVQTRRGSNRLQDPTFFPLVLLRGDAEDGRGDRSLRSNAM